MVRLPLLLYTVAFATVPVRRAGPVEDRRRQLAERPAHRQCASYLA